MSTAAFRIHEHSTPASHIREYPRATVDDQEEVLHLAVKQYEPKISFRSRHQVTIVSAHANGFPKELYEPLWDDLYERLKAKGIGICSIWIADVAHQGASGVLNERKLGNDPSWMDHPRDLFLMINHFRKQMKRPLIGIGHSMGGNNLVNLSLMHPRMFTTLILIDPVIQRFPTKQGNFAPAKASANRRERWPSRKAAEASFTRSKVYRTWDPRVLDNWVKHGLRELPTHLFPYVTLTPATIPTVTVDPSTVTSPLEPTAEKEVTLATTKHQEMLHFARLLPPTDEYPEPETNPNPLTHPDVDPTTATGSLLYRPEPFATFHKLPYVRPSVLYVYGDESPLSTPILKADRLSMTGTGIGGSGGVKKGRVSEVTFKGVGHLIPMEIVSQTADACASWIAPEIQRWRANEDAEREEWAAIPVNRRGQMSEGLKEAINGLKLGTPAPAAKQKAKL